MSTLNCRLAFLDVLLARTSRRRSGGATLARPAPGTGSPVEVEEQRGAAMRRLFPKLHAWRASDFDSSAALHAYTYLAEAESADELESRIRKVERQPHFRH